MSTKVLLVEDNTDVRLMTRYMLESRGYEVMEAADGYEAVLAAKNCPDVILMDVGMPGMDGPTASKIIRATEECATTPIVALTAFESEYLENLSDFKFDHVLKKPLEMDRLLEVLKSAQPTTTYE